MSYEQRDMSGSLFKNTNKKSDNRPDYSGSGMFRGEAVWISGWPPRADLDDDIPF